MRGSLLLAAACLSMTLLVPAVTAAPPAPDVAAQDPSTLAAICTPVTFPLYPWAINCVNQVYGVVHPYVTLACLLVVYVMCDIIGGPFCLYITCA
jgi:hypothetical protein